MIKSRSATEPHKEPTRAPFDMDADAMILHPSQAEGERDLGEKIRSVRADSEIWDDCRPRPSQAEGERD